MMKPVSEQRLMKMKKLLSILEKGADEGELSGGGRRGPDEHMMELTYSVMRNNLSQTQRDALLSRRGGGEPTRRQRLNITADLLNGILRPDQIADFKTSKLVDIESMTPTQLQAFSDMGVGYVVSRVTTPSQFDAFANRREHTLDYDQAKTLSPLLVGGETYDSLTMPTRFSSSLVFLGSLTDRPMTHYIAQRPSATLSGGGATKMRDIKNLISQIQMTLKQIEEDE